MLKSIHSKFNLFFVSLAVIILECILLCLLFVPPATGYEVSLYNIYPLWFWISIGILILLPLVYLFITHLKKDLTFSWKTAYWLLGTSCVTSVLTKIIPLARGYYSFGAGDTHSHYGTIYNIISTGVNSYNNHYPYTHVDVSLTSLLTGWSPELSAVFFHTTLYAFFILSFLIIGRKLFKNQKHTIILVSLIAIPHYMNELLTINNHGFCLIFFFLYLMYTIFMGTKDIWKYVIIAFIYAVTLWFVHPETVIISLILIGTGLVTILAYNYFHHVRFNKSSLVVILLMVVLGGGWLMFFSTTSVFTGQMNSILNPLQDAVQGIICSCWNMLEGFFSSVTPDVTVQPNLNDSGNSESKPLIHLGGSEKSVFGALFTTEYNIGEILTLGMLLYGRFMAFPICAALIILCLSIQKLRGHRLGILNSVAIMSLFVFSVFSLANMVLGTTTGLNPTRLLKTVSILAIFVIVLNIGWIFDLRKKIHIVPSVVVVISILVAAFLGVGVLYGNPELNSFNAPIMKEDYISAKTFFDTRSDEYLIEETSSRQMQSRYISYVYGGVESPSSKNIRSFVTIGNNPIADHFGYDTSNYFGDQFDSNRYFLLYPPYGEIIRLGEIPLLLGGFNPNDVVHLNMDVSSDKIKTTGNNVVYFVHSTIQE